MDYLTSLRMRKARKYLLETDKTMEDIAESIGYQNGFYFSRIFKKKVGVTPSAFRKKHRKWFMLRVWEVWVDLRVGGHYFRAAVMNLRAGQHHFRALLRLFRSQRLHLRSVFLLLWAVDKNSQSFKNPLSRQQGIPRLIT